MWWGGRVAVNAFSVNQDIEIPAGAAWELSETEDGNIRLAAWVNNPAPNQIALIMDPAAFAGLLAALSRHLVA